MEVRSIDDLYCLKRARDLNGVVLYTHLFKYRGALRHALKYALWGTAPGESITIVDSGPDGLREVPYAMPFSFVRQQVFKVLGRDTELLAIDDKEKRIVLRRTGAVLGEG